jgi:hypothetical protein
LRFWVHGTQNAYVDEDEDPEQEKAKQERLKETYKPLLEYLKKESEGVVLDGK